MSRTAYFFVVTQPFLPARQSLISELVQKFRGTFKFSATKKLNFHPSPF